MIQQLTKTTRTYLKSLLERNEKELQLLYTDIEVSEIDVFTQIKLIKMQILEDTIVRLRFMLEDNQVFIDKE